MADGLQKKGQIGDRFDVSGQRRPGSGSGLIDHQDLVIESGSVLGVFPAVDADIGADGILALDALPPVPERRTVSGHALSDDGHQAPTRCQALQGLLDVPRAVGAGPLARNPARSRGKRRVHHDDRGNGFGGQNVIELLGVLAEQHGLGK
jgi:hypothetical protein